MSLWKRTMDYLGLGPDDAYDDYDMDDEYEPAPRRRPNDIEARHEARITVVPDPEMESPHYEVERIRVDDNEHAATRSRRTRRRILPEAALGMASTISIRRTCL